MYKFRRPTVCTLLSVSFVVSLELIPATAFAQLVLEEVIVTARKREESLQESPIAVSALSGEALEDMGLRDISDLRKIVPNVDLQEGTGTSGAGNVFIRGVGARNTGINFDSGVGIYVDGVYVSRPDGAILDNVDIQSVQVLRGPQGTLFGKNTTGGAILYTTNKPGDEYEGHADIRIGNYDQLDGKLTVNTPLFDGTLLSRFSLYATTRDGYVESRSNGVPGLSDGEEFNNIDRQGAQAQLRWHASDSATLDLNYNYAKVDQAARGQNCEVVEGIPGAGWQAAAQNEIIIIPSTGQSIQAWCQDNQDLGIDRIMADMSPNKYEAETNTLSLALDWDLGDNTNFKSISAWRNTEAGEVNELDAMGIPNLGRTTYGWNGTEPRTTDAYSQEFQLTGAAFDDQLEYVVGVYGFYEDSDGGKRASPTGPFFNALDDANTVFYINALQGLKTENYSVSTFAQADWNFNEHWRLTLGLRYTYEERELERTLRVADLATLTINGDAEQSVFSNSIFIFPDGPDSFNSDHLFIHGPDPDDPSRLDPLADQKRTIDNDDVTPMASIQRIFEGSGFIDSGSAYFTVAKGFLSGGISETVDIETRLMEEYDPEEVWNYELGFKMDALDQKLRLNTAVFYTDYTDRQLTTIRIDPDTGRIAGALINAESSSIAGIELETIWIPLDNLQFTFNATFNEGEIDEYEDERIILASTPDAPEGCDRTAVGFTPVDNCLIDRSDENLPRLPDEIYYVAVQYNLETELGSFVPFLSWSLRTNIDNCFDRASCLSGLYKTDQEELSARITWRSNNQHLRVTAYGNNLTDERYITGGTPLVGVLETAGTNYNIPRTYGVEIAYDW
jgi:iron complex outermembrane recepter protein